MERFLIMFLLCIFSFTVKAACTKHDHAPVDLNTYYADANVLEGETLKAMLNTIIKGHRKYSYTPCVWDILKEADEDPNNANNVIGFYTRRSIPKAHQHNGANNPNLWDREHIWAKSHGFPRKSQHAYTDAHHYAPQINQLIQIAVIEILTTAALQIENVQNVKWAMKLGKPRTPLKVILLA